MLYEVNRLPGSKHHAPGGDGDRQGDAGEHGFDVGWHVVRAFCRVVVVAIFGRQRDQTGF